MAERVKRAPRNPATGGELARLHALSHPLRFRVYQEFAGRRRTTLQVAERLGEPPTRLYHHVNVLERVGLLRLMETRPVRGAVEKYYEAVAMSRLDPRSEETGNRPGLRRLQKGVATVVFDEARLELLAALGSKTPGSPPLEETVLVARMLVPGPAERVARLRRDLLAVIRRHSPKRGAGGRSAPLLPEGAECWSLTLAILPRPTAAAPPSSRPSGPEGRARRAGRRRGS